jgi:hypothetical protein
MSELILVGSCHGARLALEFGAEHRGIKGSFLVVPYLWSVPPGMLPSGQKAKPSSLPRAAELFDRGSSDAPAPEPGNGEVEAPSEQTPLEQEMVETCRRALEAGPIWMLIGEGDSQKPLELKERLGSDGERLEVEVAAGMIIHPVAHPEVQELVTHRLVERLTEATGPGAGAERGGGDASPAAGGKAGA